MSRSLLVGKCGAIREIKILRALSCGQLYFYYETSEAKFSSPVPVKSSSRNVWSAAELQAKNEEWQLVCANVFGLQWSQ